MGRGVGCMERMEKGKSEKGCVPQAQRLYKNPTTWATLNIPPSLCILRSHTLNAHYTAFICGRGRLLSEGRVADIRL